MEPAGGALAGGDADRQFSGVSIDTPTLTPGDLFVAIRGDRFDGSEFAQPAIERGAAGVVLPRGRGISIAPPAAVIEVDDAILALQALGQRVRRESGAKVVAITGSAGKTTTKEVAS